MRGGGIIGFIVLVWLIIGLVAAYQRDLFNNTVNTCGTAATIAVTIIAGPLNYTSVHPNVACTSPKIPQPV
jgi:hypothetical protein